ncbi:MAG: hypothetical protein ACSLE7_18035, partial [Mycobacterium sp.]
MISDFAEALMNFRPFAITTAAAALAVASFAGPAASADTAVPGQQGRDGTVTGHYTLNQFDCDYIVNYRGDFGDDPYLDDGWIMNNIKCDDGGVYSYMIVSEDDPRYTDNPDHAIWGSWETVS